MFDVRVVYPCGRGEFDVDGALVSAICVML